MEKWLLCKVYSVALYTAEAPPQAPPDLGSTLQISSYFLSLNNSTSSAPLMQISCFPPILFMRACHLFDSVFQKINGLH